MYKKTRYILIFLASLVPIQAAERFEEKTIEVESNSSFSLEHYKGKITMRTGIGKTVQIKTRIYLSPDQSSYTEEECGKVVAAMQIKINQSKHGVTVDLEDSSLQTLFSGLFGKDTTQPFVDFDILLPDDASLDLESFQGTFDIQCPSGRIDFETYKGDGNVSGVRSDLSLETYKGRLDVDIESMGHIDVDTYKGNVELNIRGAEDFTIKGETHKGDFKVVGFDVEQTQEDGETSIYLKEGSGSKRIKLDTYKGVIRLNFNE